MAIDGVSQTNQTTQTAPTDHGFGAMVRQMTPAAHNIPPGLQRKLEAGQEVKNWKLAGGFAQTDGMADAGAPAHGKKADGTADADATAHGKKADRTTDTDGTAHGQKADRATDTEMTTHGKKADRATATDSADATMTTHGKGHAKTDRAPRSG